MSRKPLKADKLTQSLFVLLDQTRETNHQAVALELRRFKLNVSEARVLFILESQKKTLTLNDLSHWILRNLNSVLILINNMEKKGLVKKIQRKDSRRVHIALTKKGQEMCKNIPEQSILMVFADLSRQEKIQLRNMLKKIRARGMNLLGFNFKPPFLPED